MDAATAEAIRDRMRQVRSELRDNVQDVVQSARTMTDWKVYVRRYPWFFVGVAAALGYAAVPKRVEIVRPDAEALLKLAKKEKLVVEPKQQAQPRRGFTTTIFDLVAHTALRAAMGMLGQKLAEVTAQQQAALGRGEPHHGQSYARRAESGSR